MRSVSQRWWLVLVLALLAACRVNFERVEIGDETGPDAGELPASFVCPASYVSTAGGHCYRFMTIASGAKNWIAAEQECELDGGHLAVIDDEAERQDLIASRPNGSDDMWIGATELVEPSFVTVTRQALFASGTIDAGNCMQLEQNGTTGASDCNGSDDYACEIDGRRADPSTYR